MRQYLDRRNEDNALIFGWYDRYFAEHDARRGKKKGAVATLYLMPRLESKYEPHQGKRELARRAKRDA